MLAPHVPAARHKPAPRNLTNGDLMALADRLDQTPRRTTGAPCSVGALLDRLPDPEAKALDRMLNELGWSSSRIYDAIADEGHSVGRQTIGRHRSRSCKCFAVSS